MSMYVRPDIQGKPEGWKNLLILRKKGVREDVLPSSLDMQDRKRKINLQEWDHCIRSTVKHII